MKRNIERVSNLHEHSISLLFASLVLCFRCYTLPFFSVFFCCSFLSMKSWWVIHVHFPFIMRFRVCSNIRLLCRVECTVRCYSYEPVHCILCTHRADTATVWNVWLTDWLTGTHLYRAMLWKFRFSFIWRIEFQYANVCVWAFEAIKCVLATLFHVKCAYTHFSCA